MSKRLPIDHLCFPIPMRDMQGNWHEPPEDFAQVGLSDWCRLIKTQSLEIPQVDLKVTVVYPDQEEEWEVIAVHYSVVNLRRLP